MSSFLGACLADQQRVAENVTAQDNDFESIRLAEAATDGCNKRYHQPFSWDFRGNEMDVAEQR
jgi:hypothetical protein